MGINIRTKGQNGEREIASRLNTITQTVRMQHGLLPKDIVDLPFQRNQNQSAVGGDDLSNPFNLAIEVKRQEALSVNAWWQQTVVSAKRSDSIAILMFRQNRKSWRVVMNVLVPIFTVDHYGPIRAELTLIEFEKWFSEYYKNWLLLYDNPKMS